MADMNATRFALVLLPVVATSLIQSHSPERDSGYIFRKVESRPHSLRQNSPLDGEHRIVLSSKACIALARSSNDAVTHSCKSERRAPDSIVATTSQQESLTSRQQGSGDHQAAVQSDVLRPICGGDASWPAYLLLYMGTLYDNSPPGRPRGWRQSSHIHSQSNFAGSRCDSCMRCPGSPLQPVV